jgi:hypothetical protein
MSYFVILDSTGNLVESFDGEGEARAALLRISEQDPDNAEEYAILQYDSTGHPVGDAIVGHGHPAHA